MKLPDEVDRFSSPAELVAAIKHGNQQYCRALEDRVHIDVQMAMDLGDLLTWLKAQVPPRSWSTWRDNTGTPRRTDENRRRLAAHRDIIEPALAAGEIKSLNDALRLLGKTKTKKPKPNPSELTMAFVAATDAERREALRALGLDDFLACVPPEWRAPLHETVRRLLVSKRPNLRIVNTVPPLGLIDASPTKH
jgi:hypothetical protein